MMKKLSQQQISTSDLKSNATLKNHRSKKQLLTMASMNSFAINEDV